MSARMSLEELRERLTAHFLRRGMPLGAARSFVRTMAAAARDGTADLEHLPQLLKALAGGQIAPDASPVVEDAAPGVVVADGANGLAAMALDAARGLLTRKARRSGIALLAIRNAHTHAGLGHALEPLAEAGLIALACGDGGAHPLAFVVPRMEAPALVWETAPNDRVGGAFRLMVEVLAAGLTGAPLPDEAEHADRSHPYPGPATGMCVMAIDPGAITSPSTGNLVAEAALASRLAKLLAAPHATLAGEELLARRADAETRGVAVPAEVLALLRTAGPA